MTANNMSESWKPGSFTKNFSWGNSSVGLVELYEIIRIGFDGRMEDIPREEFRNRVKSQQRPDYIPINFFLFNKSVNGIDYLCADELVFQALNWEHKPSFDKLALFSFNLSFVGCWKGAKIDQRRPALWANAYVRERIAGQLAWDTSAVNADDIQNFVENDDRYKAATSRKLATNLNHIFKGGRLNSFPTPRIERWWVDCLFLALDRIIENSLIDGKLTDSSQYHALLNEYGFIELTGKVTLEKQLAQKHLIELYTACGGRQRFSDENMKQRVLDILDEELFVPNDSRPRGAVHPTNPRILKSIPAACAMLARYAGFKDLSPDEMESFNLEDFIKNRTHEALKYLKENDIRPTMTAEEIMRLTREK